MKVVPNGSQASIVELCSSAYLWQLCEYNQQLSDFILNSNMVCRLESCLDFLKGITDIFKSNDIFRLQKLTG